LAFKGLGRTVKGDEDSSNRSNRSQKHKLMLKNLEMVPCPSNEYYEDGGEAKKERRSDMIGTGSGVSKKRLFRSELY
jgi:hypothetical protein